MRNNVLKAACVGAALSAATLCHAQIVIEMNLPALGTTGEITGRVTGLAPRDPTKFKLVVWTSGDNGGTWWDKMHGMYYPYYPDAGERQGAGVPINPDGTWRLYPWASDYVYDPVTPLWRAYLLPVEFETRWPMYEIEGIPARGDVLNSALAWVEKDRVTGAQTAGTNPAPSPVPPSSSPRPSAAPTISANSSPTASPSPYVYSNEDASATPITSGAAATVMNAGAALAAAGAAAVAVLAL